MSGTCAGPAVVQAVIRCLPVARRSFVLARCARSFSRSGGGPAVVQAALRCLPVVRRWFFHVFYEVSALGKLKLRLAIFQAPRPGEAVPENTKNHSKMAPRRLENRSKMPPGGLPGASREPELIFDTFLVSLGALRGAPGALLGSSWDLLGRSRAVPGGHFGRWAVTFRSYLGSLVGSLARGMQKRRFLAVFLCCCLLV